MTIYETAWSNLHNQLAIHYDKDVANQVGLDLIIRKVNISKTYFTLGDTSQGFLHINEEIPPKELLKAFKMLFDMWASALEVMEFDQNSMDKVLDTNLYVFGEIKFKKRQYHRGPSQSIFGLGTSVGLYNSKNPPSPFTLTEAMDATISLIPFADSDPNEAFSIGDLSKFLK